MTAQGFLLQGELRLAGRLDARFFALLEALEATGSINRAARTAGLSYRGAWLMLEAAGNLANEALLETATGGAGGGGTRLTVAAQGLLAAWRALQVEHRKFLRTQEAQLTQHPALAGLLRRMSMKTTARNQLAGTVSRIETGAVSSLVVLTLPGGATLTASVTNEGVEALDLKVGAAATAVFKAYAVMVAVAAD